MEEIFDLNIIVRALRESVVSIFIIIGLTISIAIFIVRLDNEVSRLYDLRSRIGSSSVGDEMDRLTIERKRKKKKVYIYYALILVMALLILFQCFWIINIFIDAFISTGLSRWISLFFIINIILMLVAVVFCAREIYFLMSRR